MQPLSTKIEIVFDAEKFKTDPINCISYNMIYEGCGTNERIEKIPSEALYNTGKSLQAVFSLLEKELLIRKSSLQLRSRKERRTDKRK